MFSPYQDKKAVQNRIRGDPTILNLLQLDPENELEISKHIILRSRWDDLVSDERRICIYFRPSRNGSSDFFKEHVLQIDVHVPMLYDFVADQVQERLCRLLQFQNPDTRTGKFEINNKILQFDGQLGDLPTLPDFFCTGSRFCYVSTI